MISIFKAQSDVRLKSLIHTNTDPTDHISFAISLLFGTLHFYSSRYTLRGFSKHMADALLDLVEGVI